MAEWKTAGKVRMTPKGEYDSTEAYEVLDMVSNDTGTKFYVAKQAVPAGTALTNTEYWTVVSDVQGAVDAAETAAQEVNDIVIVSDTQPTSETNKLWFTPNGTEVEVPTMEEFERVESDVDDLKAVVNNADNAMVDGSALNISGKVYQGRLMPNDGSVDTTARYAKLKVFPIFDGAKITVDMIYGDGTNVNRAGIGLTNKAVPENGDTMQTIVNGNFVVSADWSYSFVNTGNYKYCYIYFWTALTEYTGNSDNVTVLVDTALQSEIKHSNDKDAILGLSCIAISDFSIGAIKADETHDNAQNRASSAVYASDGGKRVLNVMVNDGIEYNVRYWNADKTSSALLYTDWTTPRTKSIDYPYYAIMLRKSDNSNFTDAELMDLRIAIYTDIGYSSVGEYRGKTISILGDSISTYGDDSQAGDSDPRFAPSGCKTTYPGNRIRYPSNTLGVTELQATYWYRTIERLGMVLGINDSWAGSRVSWNGTTESADQGADKHIASQTRINHLGENGSPDIILINAGTNDFNVAVTIGEVDYTNPIDLTSEQIAALPVDTFAAAYRTLIIRVMKTYPAAKIICMTPSYTIASARSLRDYDNYCETIKEVCDMLGVYVVDTRLNGISIFDLNTYLGDAVHYNYAGMVFVADMLTKQLLFNA